MMIFRVLSKLYSGISRHTVHRLGTDLEFALQLKARDTSANYADAMMSRARRFNSRDSLLLSALEHVNNVPGCICEFGVFAGYTLRFLAKNAPTRIVHGFDSFEGLPSDWRPGFERGVFRTKIPRFKYQNIKLHIGWFNETLPDFVKNLDEPIALLHIDCDLYSSTSCVFENLASRLAPGAVIVFDEYFNYPGWQRHEHRALVEIISKGVISGTYLAFNSLGEQVVVRVNHDDDALIDPVEAGMWS